MSERSGAAPTAAERRKAETRPVRARDIMKGAFTPPILVVLIGLLSIIIALPPLNYATGVRMWMVEGALLVGVTALALWTTALFFILPPVMALFNAGRTSWIWTVPFVAIAIAVLSVGSAFIVTRGFGAEFMAELESWVGLWGPICMLVGVSVAFGARLTRLNRRLARRLGRWWEIRTSHR